MHSLDSVKIAMIGLGYVGLPLAVEFGKKYPTIGLDINTLRIKELKDGIDKTLEVEPELLASASQLSYTSQIEDIADCNIFIVTVPTPIDKHKRPDLSPLISASQMISPLLKQDDIVIYESTVYPGATEEVCIPELEADSSLKFNHGFYAGYSPERINPGDKEHHVTTIKKITSGSTPEIADFVDNLYLSIITAGTYKASSLKVAEAAKVIENVQRDINIALVNELALIFERLNIDTLDVLEAAGSKWNFLPFRPGLVGGHCIGVDPYYLAHKAQETGFEPKIIPASRTTNEYMSTHVINCVTRLMANKKINIVDSNILILGLSFKENCPDLRNTKVVDLITELEEYNPNIDIYDPWVSADEAKQEYGLTIKDKLTNNNYDTVIIAVAHDEFKELGAKGIRDLCKDKSVIFDIKYILDAKDVDGRL